MDRIIDKFSVYDFMGYIIPGFFGVWSLRVFFNEVLLSDFFSLEDQGSINIILFLGMSFYVGVLLHECGEFLQTHIYKRTWKGMPSERFLLDDDKQYSNGFKTELKIMIEDTYSLRLNNTLKLNQDAFNLIYSDIQNQTKNGKITTLNALCGMYRNFVAGTVFGLSVFVIQAILVAVTFGLSEIAISVMYILLFTMALLILSRRLKRFSERFVDYVFREFYISNKN